MSERRRLEVRIDEIREQLAGAVSSCDTTSLEKAKASLAGAKMSEYAHKAVDGWLRDWERLEKKMAECGSSEGKGVPMDRDQLHAWLDEKFADVVAAATKLTPHMNGVERAGTIGGMLMKTGIALAAKHGAPREVIELSIAQTLDELYERYGKPDE